MYYGIDVEIIVINEDGVGYDQVFFINDVFSFVLMDNIDIIVYF